MKKEADNVVDVILKAPNKDNLKTELYVLASQNILYRHYAENKENLTLNLNNEENLKDKNFEFGRIGHTFVYQY